MGGFHWIVRREHEEEWSEGGRERSQLGGDVSSCGAGVHPVGDRPAPGTGGGEERRQAEEEGRKDDGRRDHGEAPYVKHKKPAKPALTHHSRDSHATYRSPNRQRLNLPEHPSGTIVSIGDPKKKYMRYEKIGQG